MNLLGITERKIYETSDKERFDNQLDANRHRNACYSEGWIDQLIEKANLVLESEKDKSDPRDTRVAISRDTFNIILRIFSEIPDSTLKIAQKFVDQKKEFNDTWNRGINYLL